MNRGLYAATAGMMGMLSRVQTISNNLANVNTTGYREDTLRLTTFPQQLMQRLFATGGAIPVGTSAMGIVAESTVTKFTQGALKSTDNPLDVAVQGTGFFQVQTPQGVRYTRDGTFRRDGNNQLVTSQGDQVLNPTGLPITVPAGQVVILTNGEIHRIDDVTGAELPVGQLGIVEFGEPGQLRKTGNNLFEDPGLAQAQPAQASLVRQSYLETSNVDPTRAMSDLMVAQRTYEASARMVQLQDDITSRAVNDVGRI